MQPEALHIDRRNLIFFQLRGNHFRNQRAHFLKDFSAVLAEAVIVNIRLCFAHFQVAEVVADIVGELRKQADVQDFKAGFAFGFFNDGLGIRVLSR